MESVERHLADYCKHGGAEGIESHTQESQVRSDESQTYEDVRSDDGSQTLAGFRSDRSMGR